MSATTPTDNRAKVPSPPQVSYLAEVAETIRDDALDLARRKLSPFQCDWDPKRLFQCSSFFDYFKYELALAAANVLAAHDQSVLAIYLHDPSGWATADRESGGDLPLDATVHLLVETIIPSAALEAFIAALDRTLTDSLRDLPSPKFAERASILNVIVVSEEEARLGLGHGKLLSSVFMPPLKIWECEA